MAPIKRKYECCILGAGPAGLGAALELVENGVTDLVVVDRNSIVGGLSRTQSYDGSRFDIGPHRFYSRNGLINQLWKKTLGGDFISVKRKTRILYGNNMFNYPLSPMDTFLKLGFGGVSSAIFSYLKSVLESNMRIVSFEDWVISKFGEKVYQTFFKGYTEKVWGIPCNQIDYEFAEQRIKGLDIIELFKNSIHKYSDAKTLVERFSYPLLGAGQMYEAWAAKVVDSGGTILLNAEATAINNKNGYIESIDIQTENGVKRIIESEHFFSSIPVTHFFSKLIPPVSESVRQAANLLSYRDHITVHLAIDRRGLFKDQWIYVQEPGVKMARVANYNNFSQSMASNGNKTSVSVEFFAFENDAFWQLKDMEIVKLAIDELRATGLIEAGCVEQGWVVRETEAYPMYCLGYTEPYRQVIEEIEQFHNVVTIGRAGLFRYNNQDHSTYSGILAVKNFLKKQGSPFNLWKISSEAEYTG